MAIRLRDYGTSFATRERATDIVAQLSDLKTVEIDFQGVLCSPSFLAEFMVQLASSKESVVLCPDQAMAPKMEMLAKQLKVSDVVTVRRPVMA